MGPYGQYFGHHWGVIWAPKVVIFTHQKLASRIPRNIPQTIFQRFSGYFPETVKGLPGLRVEDLKCLVGYEIVSLGMLEECRQCEAYGVRLWPVGLKVRGFRRFRV